MNFNNLNYDFVKAGVLKPVLKADGRIDGYKACTLKSDYEEDSDYELMDLSKPLTLITTEAHEIIGDKEFCKFDFTKLDLPNKPGVYLWVIDGIVVYIGRAINDSNESLHNRFAKGYGNITCRPCFKRVFIC